MSKLRKYWTLAANQENSDAHRNLGLMWDNGWGVEASPEKARVCWEKAIALGNEEANQDIIKLNNWEEQRNILEEREQARINLIELKDYQEAHQELLAVVTKELEEEEFSPSSSPLVTPFQSPLVSPSSSPLPLLPMV